jgi:membrane associated rhomboid family serine protease
MRDAGWPDEVTSAEDRERLGQVHDDYRRLRASHPFYRLGLVPANPTPTAFLTHLFVHADPLHLLFNMVFLWAVGGLLELAWGEAPFAGFYLASGIAAALTHAALNSSSMDPAIGASGAVAGLMGAFAVTQGRQPMRLALVAMLSFSPRIHFLSWPAWVFLGLWLLEQVFYALLTANMSSGIAFGAHLGGFAFGAAAGPLLSRAVRRPSPAV